jgi:hypothetical protein
MAPTVRRRRSRNYFHARIAWRLSSHSCAVSNTKLETFWPSKSRANSPFSMIHVGSITFESVHVNDTSTDSFFSTIRHVHVGSFRCETVKSVPQIFVRLSKTAQLRPSSIHCSRNHCFNSGGRYTDFAPHRLEMGTRTGKGLKQSLDWIRYTWSHFVRYSLSYANSTGTSNTQRKDSLFTSTT